MIVLALAGSLAAGCSKNNPPENEVPAADLTLVAGEITSSSVTISWTNNEDLRISGLDLVSPDGTVTSFEAGAADFAGVLCEELSAETTYEVTLQYVDGDKVYPRSQTIPITTLEEEIPEMVEWNFSNSLAPTTPNPDWNNFSIGADTELFEGLTVYAFPSSGGSVNFAEVNKSADGLAFTRELRFGGTGFPFGTMLNSTPTRFVKFHVKQSCKVIVYACSASGGSNRPFVMAVPDYENKTYFKTDSVYCSANKPTRMNFSYTGGPHDLLLYSGSSSMNLLYIKIDYDVDPTDD